MKVALSKIKKKIQREPTVEGMKLRIKSMIWNVRKKKAFKQNIKKKKEFKKHEYRLRSLWDISKHNNIQIILVLEGEEEEQETENLFEKIMKENFPNLVKEVDIQVQEAQSLKQDGPKEDHIKTHHN